MTKEILVSIRGLQFEEGIDADQIETIQKGEYYNRNNAHYVIFEEMMEGFSQPTKTIIKFRDQEMSLTKKGLVNVQMEFQVGRKNLTNYNTPYGTFLFGLEAEQITILEDDKKIILQVDYGLDVNYEHLADCKITMDIRSTDGEPFSL